MKAQGKQAVQSTVSKPNQSLHLNSMVASGVEANMTVMLYVQLHMPSACCKKTGHFQKVCMKKHLKQVHEIVQSPQNQGQEIHLHGDNGETSDSSSISSCDEDEASDSEPITVFLDTITSDNSVDSMSSFRSKIYTTVKINGQRSIQMKVDTRADTCILTTKDLQRLGISVKIKPCSSILKGYGGNFIENLGTRTL